MYLALALLLALQTAASPAPACPSDRPVDEFIAEIHKQQSKKYGRNKNPLPDDICFMGWCSRVKRPAGTAPDPSQETPKAEGKPSPEADTYSSSKSAEAKCDAAMEVAFSAAHHVDVGDQYFEAKKFRPALLRYSDALAEKPNDAAIEVRLGRVHERLNDLPKAIEHYRAAAQLPGPAKWIDEANAALARLQPAKS